MKKKKTILTILLFIIIIIFILFIIFLLVNKTNNNNLQVSASAEEKVTLGKFEIAIVNIEQKNMGSEVNISITNNYSEEKELNNIRLVFKDSDNNEITTAGIYYYGKLKAKETANIFLSTEIDLSNTSIIDYEIIKE